MTKLFKLKKWLTVPDAARHLSIVFGEEVREADLLRLALDGHLKLRVNFVNHARARCGEVASIEYAKNIASFRQRLSPTLSSQRNTRENL